MGHDWPGVADPDDWASWQAICPNPAALLNLPDETVAYEAIDEAALLAERKARFGANLKLSYKKPVTFPARLAPSSLRRDGPALSRRL